MNIRYAQASDLPAIHTIYSAARQFMAENGNPTQWGDSYPDMSTIQNDLQNRHLFVCEDESGIAGVFCYFEGTEPDYLKIYDGGWPNDEPYGVVHRLAVCGKRKGVASHCLQFACSQCENLRIDTHRNNIPMQRVLAKNGFLRCGIVHCAHGGERIAYQKTK